MRDEEKDFYIKGKIKDGYIPEKIDNLFNNSIKIIENKGEKTMEKNNNENIKNNMNQNNQSKKMPVALKRILATAACLTILLGGGNIYASTQGYDNIFFLIIEKLGITTDVFGKEEILTDRDITISYRPIEISKGTQIQINNLVIKDNKAKLKIQVNESNTEASITPIIYIVKDENEIELCNYTSANSNVKEYKEEIILNNFKEDTKKLILEIYNINNRKIVDLEINLETKEINVIGQAEEVTKISEEELKQYLGAFAMLTFKEEITQFGDFSKKTLEVENAKKIIAAIQIAKINNIDLNTGKQIDNYPILNKEKINNILQSFTTVEFNQDGVVKLDNSSEGAGQCRLSEVSGETVYVYGIDANLAYEPTCLEITDIAYIGGIYNVTFKFCYSQQCDKGFSVHNIETLPVYEMSIGLILDENNEYSKYRVSTMSEATLVEKSKEESKENIKENDSNKNEDSNVAISNTQAKNIIQSYLNIAVTENGVPSRVLELEEIGLIKQTSDFEQNSSKLQDENGHKIWNVSKDIKYSEFINKMLEYMTLDIYQKEFSDSFKEVNEKLAVWDTYGKSIGGVEVDTVQLVGEISNNKYTYEVNYTQYISESQIAISKAKFELQKNENGKYVVSAKEAVYTEQVNESQMKRKENAKQLLQNYLDLLAAYEGTPAHLLYKLNLMTEDVFYDTIKNNGHYSTTIKYSDYKDAMLKYVSETLFNQKFAKLYDKSNDENEYLQFEHLGKSVGTNEVQSITWKNNPNISSYIAQVCTVFSDGVKGDTYSIEFSTQTFKGNIVIASCENPKY